MLFHFHMKFSYCQVFDLPLFEWDLENYGATIKIAIEEVDGQETEVNSISSSIEFATNFGFDASFGEKVKFGVKFGSTIKEVLNVSNTITKTLGGDVKLLLTLLTLL